MNRLHRLQKVLTQFEKLDLGSRDSDPCLSACSPSSRKRVRYPTLWVNGLKQDVSGVPRKGKATIEYVIRGIRTDQADDGTDRHGLDIEVQSFDPAPASKQPAKKGGAIRMAEFAVDPRQRDAQGQFVGAATGGADPVTMRQAYGQKSQGLLSPGVGAAAAAAAGLLGTQTGRKVLSKGLRSASRGLHKARAAVVRVGSGKRGKDYMTQAPPRMGLGEYMQRRRMQGE